MNSEAYTDVLEDSLVPYLEDVAGDSGQPQNTCLPKLLLREKCLGLYKKKVMFHQNNDPVFKSVFITMAKFTKSELSSLYKLTNEHIDMDSTRMSD